jgi:hypothetical protein
MTKDEALDLALEFVNDIRRGKYKGDAEEVSTAIKQARSAPVQKRPQNCGTGYCSCVECVMEPATVQEPVATLWQHGETGRTRVTMPGDITDCDARWFKAADLYTTPPAQPAPVQELQRYSPNGEGGMEVDSLGAYVKHKDVTTPPAAQRQWVGLTDDEWDELADKYGMIIFGGLKQEIEAKLKEKNT